MYRERKVPENYEELYCFFGGVFCLELRVLFIAVVMVAIFYLGKGIDRWDANSGRDTLWAVFWALLAGFVIYWFLRWVGTPVMPTVC